MDSKQDQKEPLVSVMLIVKNGEPFICEQIESILAQTYRNLELIICDDFSTDRTPEIAREYMQKDSRVRWVRNERNVGVSLTFEKQCRVCRGDLIAPSDADDFWQPEKIEKQVNFLITRPEIDLVFTDDMITDKNLSARVGSFQQKMGNYSRGGLIPIEAMLKRNFLPFHVSCFRRALLDRILPMPEQSRFMYDAWVGLVASLNHPLGYIAEYLVLYRQHGNNMVGSWTRDTAFYKKRLNNPAFLRYYFQDKTDQMAIYKRLLALGGSDSVRKALTEKIAIQKVLLDAMCATSFQKYILRLVAAAWTILKSKQKYHLKQWAFLALSWGGIQKLKLPDQRVEAPAVKLS